MSRIIVQLEMRKSEQKKVAVRVRKLTTECAEPAERNRAPCVKAHQNLDRGARVDKEL